MKIGIPFLTFNTIKRHFGVLALTLLTQTAFAQSGTDIMATFEGNGLETSSVANSLVFDFNNLTSGSHGSTAWSNSGVSIGTLSNFTVENPDQYGGSSFGATNANLTNNGGNTTYGDALHGVNTNVASAATITFSSPISYFGLWWSAGDSGNALVFLNGTNVVGTFNTSWLNSSLTNHAYLGMPTGPFKGQNAGQNYAFLNFYGLSNTTFTSVSLYQIGGSGNFESDNWTVTTNAPASTNGIVFEQFGTTNGSNFSTNITFVAPTLASGIASTNGTPLGLSNVIASNSVLLDSNNALLQGTNLSTVVKVSNNAAISSNYPTEQLILSNSSIGNATVSGIPTNPIAAGSSTNITIGMTNLLIGSNTGTVGLDYISTTNGTTSTRLGGDIQVGSQTVTQLTTAYLVATPSNTTTIDLGNTHVGGTLGTGTITAANTASNTAFTETLAGIVTGTSSNLSITGTNFSGVSAGNSTNYSTTTITNTSVAGAQTSTVVVSFTSEAPTNSGLTNYSLGSSTVTITGGVYNYAAPVSTTNVVLSNIHVGNDLSTLGNGTLVIANTNPNSIYTENLAAVFTNAGTNVSSSGSFTNLAGGSTNSTSLTLGLTGQAVAGTNSGTAQVAFTSYAVNNSGLGNTALNNTNVTVTTVGYNLASNNLISSTNINLGKVHAGGTFGDGTLTIANAAPVDPIYTENLGATFTNIDTNVTATGNFTNLAGGSTNSTSLVVGIANTATPGTNTGTAQIVYTSYAVNNSGLGNTVLATNTVNITAVVYSGKSTWISTNGGNWNSFNSWDTLGGTPGVDGALSTNDTATFNTNGSGPVTLNTNARVMTLTFSNTASYTVSGPGVLTVAAGSNAASINNFAGTNTVNSALNIASPVTLNNNTGSLLNLNGPISGNGSLIQSGSGTVALTGLNNYSGGTILNSGGIITTSSSALGTGATTLNGGKLTAESSLTVSSLIWNGGVVSLPNAVSKNFITSTGNLFLNGSTHLFQLNDLQPGPRVELLAAPNLTLANFSPSEFSVTGVSGKYSLLITGGALWVEWLNPVAPKADFRPFATTPNQTSVANALNTWLAGNPSGDQITVLNALLDLPSSQLPGALNAISANFYQSFATIAFNLQNAQNNDLVERLWGLRLAGSGFSQSGFGDDPATIEEPSSGKEVIPPSDGKDFKNPVSPKKSSDILIPGKDNHWGVFVDANGIFARANSGSMLPTYNSESGGLIVGLTYKWSDSFATGIYSGYEGSYSKYNSGSKLIDNAVDFGLFAAYSHPDGKGFYADALAGGGYHNYNVSRNIAFGSINRTANASPDAGQFNSMLAAGYNWKTGNWAYGPVANIQYTYFGADGFTETGAQSLDLSNSAWNSSSLLSNLGGNLAYTWQATKNLMVVPQINMAWQHEFMQNPYTINSTLGGASITSTSATPNRDSLYTGVGVTMEFRKKWSTWLFYNTFAGNQNLVSQNVFWGVGFRF